MAFPTCLLGRAASLPAGGEPGRRSCSLDLGAAGRGRRSSVEVAPRAAARGDSSVLAASVLAGAPARGREGVMRSDVAVEVGSAVDVAEQRRRLERFWHTEPGPDAPEAYDSDASSEASTSGRGRAGARAHLQQRWQQQSSQQEGVVPSRTMGRRRGRSAGASLRRSRTPTGRRRARPLGRVRALPRRSSSSSSSADASASGGECPEAGGARLLARLALSLDHRRRTSQREGVALGGMFTNWGNTGVLDREVEAQLASMVQLGLATRAALDAAEAEAGRSLSAEEREAAAGCSCARIEARLRNRHGAHHLLVQFNLRLLASVARNFEGRGLELEDLIAEGMAGLDRAVLRFDPSKGYKFSTYAYMWIRQAVSRSIMEHCRVVRLPEHIYALFGRVQKTRELLAPPSGGAASDEAVAAALGLDAAKVAAVTAAGRQALSTEDSVPTAASARQTGGPADDSATVGDTLAAEQASPLEELEAESNAHLIRADVDRVLAGLTLRERNVLRYRYGLLTEPLTLNELSAAYGITRERVRQISEVALAKLQLRQAAAADGSGRQQPGQPGQVGGRARAVPRLRPELYGCGA